MSAVNYIVLFVQIIIILWMVRTALKVAAKETPKFTMIGATIQYYKNYLESNDKIILSPLNKDLADENSMKFLQFKVFSDASGRRLDLVYPIVKSDRGYEKNEKELLDLIQFLKLDCEMIQSPNSNVTFYFVEIDPENENHICFLILLGVKQRNFKMTKRFKCELISGQNNISKERYSLQV